MASCRVSIHITEQDSKKAVCCKSDGMRFAGADTTVKLRQDMSYIISITTVPAVAIRFRHMLPGVPPVLRRSTAVASDATTVARVMTCEQQTTMYSAVDMLQLTSVKVYAKPPTSMLPFFAAA
jgi:hypothetical protein